MSEIYEKIETWMAENLPGVQFRPYQKETTHNIIKQIVSTDFTENQIIEAPTGSGKSLMIIVAAGVLASFYNKSSYILCSDLYLWSQYDDFIRKSSLPFGTIKGQNGNYMCPASEKTIETAQCRMAEISWKRMYDSNEAAKLGFECAQKCPYIGLRKKAEFIEIYKESKDKILVGPSLYEGIDLPGDLIDFMVIMKVPFPHLGNKLVQAKMKYFPLWYKSKTSNTIIQAIGRGNRFVEDKCTTYILDGCFGNLYKTSKTQYPVELQKRIQVIK